MTARLIPLEPRRVAELAKAGEAVLIDIREPDEFARRRARGAVSRPVSALTGASLPVTPGAKVVFTCKSGMRTAANCDRLADAVDGEAYVLDGGLDAWGRRRSAGGDRRQGAARDHAPGADRRRSPGSGRDRPGPDRFARLPALSAFVGAGLAFAGASGWCGMAKLLAIAPWNRPAKA